MEPPGLLPSGAKRTAQPDQQVLSSSIATCALGEAESYACSKKAVAECSLIKDDLDDPSVQHHCCQLQDGEEHWCNGQMTEQEEHKSVWPQVHPIWMQTVGRKDID